MTLNTDELVSSFAFKFNSRRYSKADFLADGVTPVPDDIEPLEMNVVGNYAVQISWPDGFSQVATFAAIRALERLVPVAAQANVQVEPDAATAKA